MTGTYTFQNQPPTVNGKSKPTFFQPKLTVNQPNDVYEQEADAMADQVMRTPDSSTAKNSFFKPAAASVQRKCAQCEEEEKQVQRKETTGEASPVAPADIQKVLKGPGKPLDQVSRSFMEPRFGHDFSSVQIHEGEQAASSARTVNALAFTSGNHIVFNSGQYNPGSNEGKKLLAHELTHVVQQKAANNFPAIQRTIGDGHDLSSPRFANDVTLEDVYDGNTQLAAGSNGAPVEKVQHALQDAGVFLPASGIDGIYEAETTRSVTAYQNRKHIIGDTAGQVGVETITALNNDFPAVTDAPATLSQSPADLACIQAILCPWNRALINDFHSGRFRVILVDRLYWADEMFDGTGWVANPMEGAGETSSGVIRLGTNDTCDKVAQALYHEYQHARSPRRLRSQTWAEEESNAYRLETAWSISRGLSPDPSLVTTDAVTGEQTVNTAGVQSQVGTYPGMVSGSNEEVIAKVGATRVRVRRANGSVYVRAAVSGDSVPGPRRVDNPRTIAAASWACP